ncbi:unnamed protein product [Lasius platythorax]|uniref:Uncharacterized protein n=1 Tax=Lasius platythorax TaxID=488582 RepID=A0AAV2N4C7_9HYME
MISGAHTCREYSRGTQRGTQRGYRVGRAESDINVRHGNAATGHATEITGPISPAGIYGRRDFALLEPFTVFAL